MAYKYHPDYKSTEEKKREIIKCGRDPIYFIKNYILIAHPLKGIIPFNLFKYQEELINDFEHYRFNIILKARQLGITTLISAYIVWMMLFYRDKNILVLSTKLKTAELIVKTVKSIMKRMPDYIKISKIAIDNAASFEMDNGSRIKPTASTEDAGRSEALSLLVVDEAAHIENLEEIWTAIYSCVSTGGKCFVNSTPNGTGNMFHKLFVGAQDKANDFHPIVLPWDVHPERDLEWFQKETKNMSQRSINQELLCDFLMSGETVFEGTSIARIKKNIEDPKYRTGFDRNLWIWKEFIQGTKTLLTADVARGDGADYSVFHIFNLETMEVMAEYQGKLPPDMFAQVLYQAGSEYGNCMVVVENNTIGFSVLTRLEDMKYPNIYYSTKSSHEYCEPWEAEYKGNSVVPGFTMSGKMRPLVIAKLEEYVRNNKILIRSTRLLNEMNTFIWNNGRPEAMRSYNDDLIMACAIGCWVRDTVLVINQRDNEYKKVFLDCMCKSTKTINTSGIVRYEDSMKEKLQEHIKNYNEYSWIYSK